MSRFVLGISLLVFTACGKGPDDGLQALTEFQKLEGELVDSLNSLRRKPQSHIPKLEAMLGRFRGDQYKMPSGIWLTTNEGPGAVEEAIQVLRRESPLDTYARDTLLDQAARDHQLHQETSGETGHHWQSPPEKVGLGPSERLKKYATYSSMGENIAYGPFDTGEEFAHALFIDDGVPDRGHRHNMLYPGFKEVGVACGPHPVYQRMCVINYGTDVRKRPW